MRQQGDVFARVINNAAFETNISLPKGDIHSSYWTHIWFPCGKGGTGDCTPPLMLQAGPQTTSHWVEIGGLLDGLNSGEWQPLAAVGRNHTAQLEYTLEIGVLNRSRWREGQQLADLAQRQDVDTIASFDVSGCPNFGTGNSPAWPGKLDGDGVAVCQGIVLTFDANTVGTRRIRRVEEQFLSVFRQVKAHAASLPTHLKPPNITVIVTAPSFTKVPTTVTTDPNYNESIDSWHQMFGFYNMQVRSDRNLTVPTLSFTCTSFVSGLAARLCEAAILKTNVLRKLFLIAQPDASLPTLGNETESCAKRMQYSSFHGPANDSLLLPMLEKDYGNAAGPAGNVHECIGVLTLGDVIEIPPSPPHESSHFCPSSRLSALIMGKLWNQEIGIGGPTPSAATTQASIDAGFVAWLNSEQQLGDNSSAAGCTSWSDCHYNVTASLNQTNPRLWFYSTSYGWTFGIREWFTVQ